MRTAVLERLSSSLCDAVVGRARQRRACWPRSSAATCSSSRSTPSGAGSATTRCSARCSSGSSSASRPRPWPTCTAGRAPGSRDQRRPARDDRARDLRRRRARRRRRAPPPLARAVQRRPGERADRLDRPAAGGDAGRVPGAGARARRRGARDGAASTRSIRGSIAPSDWRAKHRTSASGASSWPAWRGSARCGGSSLADVGEAVRLARAAVALRPEDSPEAVSERFFLARVPVLDRLHAASARRCCAPTWTRSSRASRTCAACSRWRCWPWRTPPAASSSARSCSRTSRSPRAWRAASPSTRRPRWPTSRPGSCGWRATTSRAPRSGWSTPRRSPAAAATAIEIAQSLLWLGRCRRTRGRRGRRGRRARRGARRSSGRARPGLVELERALEARARARPAPPMRRSPDGRALTDAELGAGAAAERASRTARSPSAHLALEPSTPAGGSGASSAP